MSHRQPNGRVFLTTLLSETRLWGVLPSMALVEWIGLTKLLSLLEEEGGNVDEFCKELGFRQGEGRWLSTELRQAMVQEALAKERLTPETLLEPIDRIVRACDGKELFRFVIDRLMSQSQEIKLSSFLGYFWKGVLQSEAALHPEAVVMALTRSIIALYREQGEQPHLTEEEIMHKPSEELVKCINLGKVVARCPNAQATDFWNVVGRAYGVIVIPDDSTDPDDLAVTLPPPPKPSEGLEQSRDTSPTVVWDEIAGEEVDLTDEATVVNPHVDRPLGLYDDDEEVDNALTRVFNLPTTPPPVATAQLRPAGGAVIPVPIPPPPGMPRMPRVIPKALAPVGTGKR